MATSPAVAEKLLKLDPYLNLFRDIPHERTAASLDELVKQTPLAARIMSETGTYYAIVDGIHNTHAYFLNWWVTSSCMLPS